MTKQQNLHEEALKSLQGLYNDFTADKTDSDKLNELIELKAMTDKCPETRITWNDIGVWPSDFKNFIKPAISNSVDKPALVVV